MPLFWSGIEVVITALTRNQVGGNVSWVRIPPSPFQLPQTFVQTRVWGIFSLT